MDASTHAHIRNLEARNAELESILEAARAKADAAAAQARPK